MKTTLLSSLTFAILASAVHLPVQRARPRASGSSNGSTLMSKHSSGAAGLSNLQNNLYAAEVKLGKSSFTLALDTGSSDLWFAQNPSYKETFASAKIYESLKLNITYGTGWVYGPVAQVDKVTFAGFTVKNQSLLYVTEEASFFTDFIAQQPLFQGLLGLSFDTLSDINTHVRNATHQTWGRSIMSNIFLSDPATPNHIAFFLDRTGDLNDTDTGYFDIGTYAPGYEAVANETKHDVFTGYSKGVLQWNVLLTKLTIGGKKQKLKTGVKADKSQGLVNVPPSGSISALFDTGTSAGQLPPHAFKALYESMGGVLIKGSSMYAVPCMAEVDMELSFGHQKVAVHPLDLTSINVQSFSNGQNYTLCTSSYEAGSWEGGDNDIILGDAFLRNIYAVYNYGDYVKTESGYSAKSPFIQFLPLTNSSTASGDFKKARAQALASLPPQVDVKTVNDPNPKPLKNTSTGSGSGYGSGVNSGISNSALNTLGSGSSDDASSAQLRTLSTLAPIILGLLCACAALLIILIVIAGAVFSHLKKNAASKGGNYKPLALATERAGEYKDEPVKYDSQF